MRIKKVNKNVKLNSLSLIKITIIILIGLLVSNGLLKNNKDKKASNSDNNIYKTFLNKISGIPGFDTNIFKYNLNNNLKIVKSEPTFKSKINNFINICKRGFTSLFGGEYDYKENKINLYNNSIYDSTWHELLHSASTTNNNFKLKSGFYFINYKYNVGYGLNEGYTQLLTNRYFNKNNDSYSLEVKYASIIETVVGKSNMTNMYSRADLSDLIISLEQYMPREEIGDFIKKLDYISFHWTNVEKDKKVYEYFVECNNFLIRLVSKYVLHKVKGGLISEKQGCIELCSLLNKIYSTKNLELFMDYNNIKSPYQFTSITNEEISELYEGTSYKRILFN